MAVELEQAGIDYTIIEKAEAVGGTWWHNRYPGCGVDTPSHLYCFSFFDEYDWPAYFSLRDTLHDYFETVATSSASGPHIRLRHRGRRRPLRRGRPGLGRRRAHGRRRDRDAARRRPHQRRRRVRAPRRARPPGPRHFEGERAHTARWPEGIDLTGKRVGVIGNGASAMQLVPAIVDDAEHVYGVHPLGAVGRAVREVPPASPRGDAVAVREVPLYRLWYRLRLVWNFNDKIHPALQRDPDWEHPERSLNAQNDYHREYFTQYILDELGDRKDLLAPKVLPTYPPFGKRMLMDNGWFRTLTRDDVTLDPTGAAEIRPHAVVAGDGAGARGRRAGAGHRLRRRALPRPDGASSGAPGARSARRGRTTTPGPTSAPSCPTCRTSSASTAPTCRPATAAAC